MAPNEKPASNIASTIPEEKETAIWFAYQELLEKHKDLITFAKMYGIYDLYEPKPQHFTTH